MSSQKEPKAKDGFVRGTPPKTHFAKRSLLMVAIAGALVFLAVPLLGENGLAAWYRLRSTEKKLNNEVCLLEAENSERETELVALKENPETLEKLARERHNMRLPEEKVLLILQ